jgi:hypothetical protein
MLPQAIRSLARQSLKIDVVRHYLTYARFLYFAKARKSLRTLGESGGVSKNTVAHNMTALESTADIGISRSRFLVWTLSLIETLNIDSRVLSIGPRSEGELFHLVGYGFRPSNIRGLDLISYSPWIDLGDMHAIPYGDNEWDAVILGWVIAYTQTPEVAAREVVRVTKNGGVVAVGVEYNPLSDSEVVEKYGYRVGRDKRIESVKEILSFFGDHVDRVYFAHDIHPDRRDAVGAIAVVFSIKK